MRMITRLLGVTTLMLGVRSYRINDTRMHCKVRFDIDDGIRSVSSHNTISWIVLYRKLTEFTQVLQ
jgi:hypothetical protein